VLLINHYKKIIKIKKVVFSLLIVLNLFSCASIPSKNLTVDKFKLEEYEGAIAGVIAIQKITSSTGSNILYSNDEIQNEIQNDKNKKYNYGITIGTRGTTAPEWIADFKKAEDDKFVYFFFVRKEKPGKYKFNEYTFFFNSGYIQEFVANKIDPNIEFNIEKGKIKYFGTIFLDSKARTLKFTQEFKEFDIQKFKEKLPHIKVE
jgi:hypothetical protein